MATKKKMLQAAAGQAGGEPGLDIDEVFSTYLYEGLSTPQVISNGIPLSTSGPSIGTSTKFDGANDYLSKSSALTGAVNGKQITISVWVYLNSADWGNYVDIFDCGANAGRLGVREGQLYIYFVNNTASDYALTSTNLAPIAYNGWQHILISFDVSDTSKRHLYINDALPSYTSWGTYQNQTANLTSSPWAIGSQDNGNSYHLQGNIAHLFYDDSYLDLSVTSNRRNFIDANGGSTPPSTVSALNPLIYLPMTEDYTIGENQGTGGDFTSNGSPTIVNVGTEHDADLETEGGLVWIKNRPTSNTYHALYDTERGTEKYLMTNVTSAEQTYLNNGVTSFNADGFTVEGASTWWNASGQDIASWTFRKAPKFFDCVQYSGDGTGARQLSHNLDNTIGTIIVKRTDGTGDWWVYHRSARSTNTDGYLRLNATNAESGSNQIFPVSTYNSTQFTVGNSINVSSETYVAYLFAHNDGDGEFGPDGDQDIIKCGSYTGTGTAGLEVDLGFEPQWLLVKNANDYSNWNIYDVMRGINVGGTDYQLEPNTSDAELGYSNWFDLNPNGFTVQTVATAINGSGNEIIYIAIRRGPLAAPESATEVFGMDINSSTNQTPIFTVPFTPDFVFSGKDSGADKWYVSNRLTNGTKLNFASTASEVSNVGYSLYFNGAYSNAFNGYSGWLWKRAPGFFDVVAYTGDSPGGVGVQTVSHNLGVAPEMIWYKRRDGTGGWGVLVTALGTAESGGIEYGQGAYLNETSAFAASGWWGSPYVAPTATEFTVRGSTPNASGGDYIAYLFASLPGISKVGSYTGNGTSQTIDCGFTSGARFVLLKVASTDDAWFLWDSVRGINAGAEPYLRLNYSAAEVTTNDRIDPHSSGFAVDGNDTSNNKNGETYIFYAIA